MKTGKLLAAACALLCVPLFVGCSTYVPPKEEDRPSSPVTPDDPVTPANPSTPSTPSTPAEGESAYTVSLVLSDGEKTPVDETLYPSVTNLSAVWTDINDSKNVVTARFNSSGVATASLDGEYRVSLMSLPLKYSYNPNINIAGGDYGKDIEIELTALKETKGIAETPTLAGGEGTLQWKKLNGFGTYRVTLKSGEEERLYIKTGAAGAFSIRTVCDIYANNVKATITKYRATFAWFGGADADVNIYADPNYSASYAKNLIWFEENTRNQELYFSIKAEGKNGGEVTVDFTYAKEEKQSVSDTVITVASTENFPSKPEKPAGKFTCFADINDSVLDDKLVEKHDDGYYYLKTGEKLFAQILGGSNPVLGGSNFSNTQISLTRLNGKNYNKMIRTTYASHVNSDGCYPVNEELKNFLFDYSSSQKFFMDGNGFAETLRDQNTGEPCGYKSNDASQWLFACGIYKTS